MRYQGFSWVALLFVTLAPCVHAASEQEIEAARLKGMEFLKSQQQTDGSWEYPNYATGITALCTLALIENGVPVSDPVVDRGYRFVKKQVSEVDNTYEICLSILLMARVGDRLDKPSIRTLGARLLAGQNEGGGWSYKCPKAEASSLANRNKSERQKGAGDNSCTQFGVLGLWVASRYGVPVEEAMTEVATRFLDGQNQDGGWSYRPSTKDKPEPTGSSMTCAGLFSLTVARAARIREAQKDKTATGGETRSEKATLMQDPSYSKGFNRVGEFARGIGPGSPKYFLWSVERLGVLLGLQKLGQTDWFDKGADALVKTQRPDGSWSEGKEALSDASFSILFLRKANLGSDISRLLEGEPLQQFAISSRADQPRFDSLQDALKEAKAGEVIRIDGNGPFKMSHEVYDRDLTLQAGYGYEPVFELQIGVNPLGLRYKPERDADARQMMHVKSGVVTLEGLRLQLDPPLSTQPLPWKAILVSGGQLRLLNCMISEANRRGTSSITLTSEGSLYIRNSVLVNSRAAIEIFGAEKPQDITIENSILYATKGLVIANDSETKQPAAVNLKFYHDCIQCDEAISCPNLKGTVDIESYLTLYRCDSLSLSLLPTATSKEGRAWKGKQNVYNVQKWLGSGGKAIAKPSDAASFSQFWGDQDKSGSKQTIAWVNPRKNGGFSHVLNPQDWDLGEKSELSISLIRYGISAGNVGPGGGFSRYREDFRYTGWRRGISEPDQSALAPAQTAEAAPAK